MKLLHALLLIALFLAGCVKKEVQLPVIGVSGVAEVQNHSGIWLFYETSGEDSLAALNKNNKLLNTNWIFHIDKRLRMKQVIPHLEALQEDRNKESFHKKEGMLNYFSYANSSENALSLVPFPNTTFTFAVRYADLPLTPEEDSCLLVVEVREEGLMTGNTIAVMSTLEQELFTLLPCKGPEKSKVRLVYEENISYQSYLEVRARLASADIALDPVECVYRVK